ncbi:hypothetical protein SEEE2490_20611, partial [Salmonella enterica subsp. enterica serovar Enteritidis str. CVM_81-2490]
MFRVLLRPLKRNTFFSEFTRLNLLKLARAVIPAARADVLFP